jgi:hypothetical protein
MRDNQPQPLYVEAINETISWRDLTDGERSDLAKELEKERRQRVGERYAELRQQKITDKDFITLEIEAINDWAFNELLLRSVLKMVVDPDLTDDEIRREISGFKLDAIARTLNKELEKRLRKLNNALEREEEVEEVKKS